MTRADQLLLIVMLIGIGVLFRQYWTPPRQATQAVVSGPQQRLDLDLNADTRVHIHGPLGDSIIEVVDGAVRFVSSPCRHQICVRSGWHHSAGAVAACVPNRISVVLSGGQSEFDAISY